MYGKLALEEAQEKKPKIRPLPAKLLAYVTVVTVITLLHISTTLNLSLALTTQILDIIVH